LFESIKGFRNLYLKSVKHSLKNQILVPAYIKTNAPLSRHNVFIFDIDKLEITKIPNNDGYNWTQSACSSDGKYDAISIKNHPFFDKTL